MKYLLSILCLFVLSCDSNGDNNEQILLSQLNGEWWTEYCEVYTGDGCAYIEEISNNTVGVEDCESSEYFYIKFEDGISIDCRTDSSPECDPNETGVTTIEGNIMTNCADNYEDLDDRCIEGELEFGEDLNSLIWSFSEEVSEGCIKEIRRYGERK